MLGSTRQTDVRASSLDGQVLHSGQHAGAVVPLGSAAGSVAAEVLVRVAEDELEGSARWNLR